MMRRVLLWLNLYGRQTVQHKLKNSLKTPKRSFQPFFELMPDRRNWKMNFFQAAILNFFFQKKKVIFFNENNHGFHIRYNFFSPLWMVSSESQKITLMYYFVHDCIYTKGQIISKGLLVSLNSPKKRTNEFVFTTATNFLWLVANLMQLPFIY